MNYQTSNQYILTTGVSSGTDAVNRLALTLDEHLASSIEIVAGFLGLLLLISLMSFLVKQ